MIGAERAATRGWFLVVVTSLVYSVAVLQRSAFGVRVDEAISRYEVSATSLAYLPAASLLAYALMQLPVGLLLDRVGPSSIMIAAIVCLSAGSIGLGLSHDVSQAIGARVVLGVGDACTYLGVLRVAGTHLPPAQFGLAAAFANACGAAGQLVGTFPLSMLLDELGWTKGFVAIGALTSLLLIPQSRLPTAPVSRAGIAHGYLEPATRERPYSLLFAGVCHALLMSQFLAFTIMWGHPYLMETQQLTTDLATGVIAASIVSFGCCSAIMARWRRLRATPITVGLAALPVGLLWLAFGYWPPPAPFALTVLLSLCSGAAAAAVAVTFSMARDGSATSRIGYSTGVVNMTSFVVTSVLLVLIGLQARVTGETVANLPTTLALFMLLLGATATVALRAGRRSRGCGA